MADYKKGNSMEEVTTPLPTRVAREERIDLMSIVPSDRGLTPKTRTDKQGGGSIILFPGSFDPFTIGHADLVERALQLFDEIIIAVGINEQKSGWIPVEQRVQALRDFYQGNAHVRVESYSGLTTDFASSVGASAILRGVRTVKDFEYEQQMADINRHLSGIDTVCLFAGPQLAAISSSLIRELAHFGKDITPYLPEGLQYAAVSNSAT